jgi:hypothetical protein
MNAAACRESYSPTLANGHINTDNVVFAVFLVEIPGAESFFAKNEPEYLRHQILK